jgi:type IV secretory pathway VirJ component
MRRFAQAAVILLCAGTAAARELAFEPFGDVTVYRPEGEVRRVVLFVSGDGGWNRGVVDMARTISREESALVLGIDIRHYLRGFDAQKGCGSFAIDLEALSQYAQKSLALDAYLRPLLVGYSSGATLVYAALVQAPPGTFAGAVSLGFCPDLGSHRTFCPGSGGLSSRPMPRGKGRLVERVHSVAAPWIVLQGGIDQVCDSASTADYVDGIEGATLVPLPKVGHGFSVERNWMPQFREALAALREPPVPARAVAIPGADDLPVVEVPATVAARGDLFAVILSGDGGWAGIDRSIGNALAADGVPVAGLDSLRYFWRRRTPDELARDLQRLIEHYAGAWSRSQVLLVGYSRGADVLPFAVRRLPPETQRRVRLVALLGPAREAGFEFYLSDWLGGSSPGLPVLPEVNALHEMRVLCVSGAEEKDSLCRVLDGSNASVMTLAGGHHFGGDYQSIAARIVEEARGR